MQVSHLHPKQQRLVAHHVLVDADHLGGYAEVVVTCTSRDVPSDHLLEQLRNEGWKVHDFRAQAQRRRDGKTF